MALSNLPPYQTLRLILGDQLNASHSWFKHQDDSVLYIIAELKQETDYVRHHGQKVLAFFAAMAQFAKAIKSVGHQVLYLTLDDTAKLIGQHLTLDALLDKVIEQTSASYFQYQRPDEYRLSAQLSEFGLSRPALKVSCVESEHFYLPFNELGEYGQKAQHQRMAFFYRKLRKRFALLMDENQPTGGKWSFDSDNRQKLTIEAIKALPKPKLFVNDVADIHERLKRHKVATIGQAPQNDLLLWPINRKQSLELLSFFCSELLPNFGRYQDAMIKRPDEYNDTLISNNELNSGLGNDLDNDLDNSWSLYHARLSFSLNSKMLSPKQVVDAAIKAYKARPDEISIAQIEGFVRQILGWREYIRMVYWLNMPEYVNLNHLNASRPLPSWFWTGDTHMRCLQDVIKQSLQYGYAHHIQRLMVTGNFCLLAGINPDEVDNWYLGIYVDAIEWVELPNTRGMSQFADGGLVGSKAYGASGNYINKMTNYCKSCRYDVKQKTGDNACPLNSLYWRFMLTHQQGFSANPRNAMVYNNWKKQPVELQQQVLAKAEACLIDIEVL